MSVVLYHILVNDQLDFPEGVARFAHFIPRGVDLFFVISGFIMWVTTARKELTPRAFMVRRIIRIVPLYWFVTLAVVTCKLIAPRILSHLNVSTSAVLKSVFFIPYDSITSPGHVWPVVEPGWTLNYEMFFYALFAISLALTVRARFVALLGVMGALSLIGEVFGPFANPIITTYTSTLLLEFAAGVVVAEFWLRGTLRPGPALSIVMLSVGFLLLQPSGAPGIGAALVVSGSLSALVGKLRSRLLLELGDASYSIYLTHALALGAFTSVWRHAVPHPSLVLELLSILIALPTCAIVGWVSYRIVERPITRYLHRLARAPKAAVPQAV